MNTNDKDDKLRGSSCLGKHKHESFAAANQQLKRGKRDSYGMNRHFKLTVYHCLFCGFWHIGGNKVFRKKKRPVKCL